MESLRLWRKIKLLVKVKLGLPTNKTKNKEDLIVDKDISSLEHTSWRCQYHVVFAPRYRRMEIYGKIKEDIGVILCKLCQQKGVEIIEAQACPDHIHMLISIPPKYSVSQIMGYLKGKSSLYGGSVDSSRRYLRRFLSSRRRSILQYACLVISRK